jgi:hypothetical protein
LDAAECETILVAARHMAGDALRVLAVARKRVADIAEAERDQQVKIPQPYGLNVRLEIAGSNAIVKLQLLALYSNV